MNWHSDFDLGPGVESESSNSVGNNTYYRWDSPSQVPETDCGRRFGFSLTSVETENGSTCNSIARNTSLAQAKNFPGKSQLSGDGDSDNTDIQKFICTLRRCNYPGDFESEKEDSWNQVESTKLRLTAADLSHRSLPAKPKTHECSICGLEFRMGQALGGHKRRHSVAVGRKNLAVPEKSKRFFGLDLNLTPLENDLLS